MEIQRLISSDEIEWDQIDPNFEFDDGKDIMELREFIAAVETRCFTPDDGGIGEILLNGVSTKYHLGIWMCWDTDIDDVPVTLEELATLPGRVEIVWYSK